MQLACQWSKQLGCLLQKQVFVVNVHVVRNCSKNAGWQLSILQQAESNKDNIQ
jgi:hypothetical protein